MISFVIPTFNRKDCLRDLLEQLKEFKQCEVIVVDGGDDGTDKMIKKEFSKFKYFSLSKDKDNSPSHGKRVGIKNAKKDIICVMDDDVILKDNFLEPILEDFSKGYKVVQPKIIFKSKNEDDDPNECKDTGKRKWNLMSAGKWNCGSVPKTIESTVETCLFFRKDLMKEVPWFDPNLIGDAYGESISFEMRLKEKDIPILFDPRSVVIHKDMRTGGTVSSAGKKRKNYCSEYTKIIVHNLMYLNKRFNPRRVFVLRLYFILAGIFLSLRYRRNCLKHFLEGMSS